MWGNCHMHKSLVCSYFDNTQNVAARSENLAIFLITVFCHFQVKEHWTQTA